MMRRLCLLLLLVLSAATAVALNADVQAYRLTAEAAALIRAQRYAEAMRRLDEAAALDGIYDITRTQIDAGRIRAAIGLGDYMLARSLYTAARVGSPDEEADDMLRLIGGELCFSIGDYERALAVADSVTATGYIPQAAAQRVRALTMLGRTADAVAAADAAMKGIPDSSPARAPLLQNRGYALWEAGRAAEAAADLRRATALIPPGTDRCNILGNLALAESHAGHHTAAIRAADEAVAGLPAGTPDGLAARRKRAEVLLRAGRRADASASFRRFFRSERDALLAALPAMPPAMRLNYWCREKPLLSRCFALGDADADFLYDVALFRRQTSLLGMRDTMRLQQLLSADAGSVRRSLPRGHAAVEFVSYEPERGRTAYAAIVLPKRGRARFVPLFADDDLHEPETVGSNSLYNAVRRESRAEKNLLYADSLWGERVWRQVLDVLPPGTTDIWFAPEGIFHLWGIENMPFRGRDALRLRRVSSTAVIGEAASGSASRGRALVVGGLDYNAVCADTAAGTGNSEAFDMMLTRTGRPGRFSYLRGTLAEADSIGRTLPAGAADVCHDMPEATLKAIMPAYDIVHIATHGYSLSFGMRRRPEFMADSVAVDRSLLLSGLALSGANAGYDPVRGEDGLLSAREICDLDLGGVDFVILSACRTAVGDISDEGAAGLVRGLKMAGVRSVMATLWEVDDMSAMLFMQAFHRALGAGAGAREAYLEAQRRLRCEPVRIPYRRFSPATMAREQTVSIKEVPPFNEPYHWAPFILIEQ
ncbi:MAG: CHAT domain-containing protein [Muribaculaceae bacterium]|nr:CHAT domain-containing protein [Muribaculaceae bacterium]